MAGPKRLKMRVAFLGFVLATLAVSFAIVVTSRKLSVDVDRHRQLSLRSIISHLRDPKSVTDKDPHFWKYAYIIVNYHDHDKSGHALSDILVKHINSNLNQFGRPLKRMKVQPRRDFNSRTKCSEMSFAPGTITVIGGPELHCSTKHLRDILLSHPDPKQPKWGVKVIHLVRNPFTMAVSNYNYHKQDPTPELFVNRKNPCDASKVGRYTLKDLAAPLLTQPKLKIRVQGQLPKVQSIMKREDFNNIAHDCSSLYQTKPGMENATFYDHLRALDPTEGLRMATADKMDNIVLMAVDLIQLKRVRELVKASNPNHINGDMEVKTISIDDFIHQPGSSMYQLYDFVFKDLLSEETKITRSKTYEQSYLRERESHHPVNKHITYGKFDNTAALIEYLRGEPVFGPPLTKIEALLDEILYEESVGMERMIAGTFS
eukprot:scaffold19268_cov148-Skeletonema_menzelii.AAC.9